MTKKRPKNTAWIRPRPPDCAAGRVARSLGHEGEVGALEGDRLRDGTAEGQHGQAAVLQLLDLHLHDPLLRLGQEGLAEPEVARRLERQLLKVQAQLLEADGLDR